MCSRTSRRCSSRSGSSSRSTSSPSRRSRRVDAVYEYPKQLLPSDVSTETMRFFLDSDGVVGSLQRSIYVAAHHHRRLPRHRHAGGLCARALLVPGSQPLPARDREHPRLPAHHHRGSAGRDLHPVGTRRHRLASRWPTSLTLPITVLITASIFVGIPYELEEAAMTLGCSRLSAFRGWRCRWRCRAWQRQRSSSS